MAKTIIQTIGPLYGDVVNGTVFGRPNGSVFVPSANTISIKLADSAKYVRVTPTPNRYGVCASNGNFGATFQIVAESQDTASYIATYLEDENGDAVGSERSNTAGIFNYSNNIVGTRSEDDPLIVADDSYNLVAVLYSASGVPVATAKVALTGVVVV